jgi:hypothetical protein
MPLAVPSPDGQTGSVGESKVKASVLQFGLIGSTESAMSLRPAADSLKPAVELIGD